MGILCFLFFTFFFFAAAFLGFLAVVLTGFVIRGKADMGLCAYAPAVLLATLFRRLVSGADRTLADEVGRLVNVSIGDAEVSSLVVCLEALRITTGITRCLFCAASLQ